MMFDLSSLVGRERELPELLARFETGPVLTLVGPPGVGKSRLAAHLAATSSAAHGRAAVSVNLTETADASKALQLVAGPLRLRRPTTVVLDDCDNALPACREFLTRTLGQTPETRIIATCRERLGLTIESIWQVRPLPVPATNADCESIAASPSVMLFVDRAQAVDARFALTTENAKDIATICREVDGLPLAVELAAARMDVLTPRDIVRRLEPAIRLVPSDKPHESRHTGMAASLEWTIGRLRGEEQRLLWCLSIFRASWDVGAAEAVGADPEATTDVPALLARMVACSLVYRVDNTGGTDVRYALPSVVRRYALHQLEATGGAREVRRKHAEWCRLFVESVPFGTGNAETVDRLRLAQSTLVDALDWAVEAQEVDAALSLANVLHRLWLIQGQATEARAWLGRVLTLHGGTPQLRAMVTNWESLHAIAQGDMIAALALSVQARAVEAESGDPLVHAVGLDGRGVLHWSQGDIDHAEELFVQELQFCLDHGLNALRCASLYRLADVQLEKGDLAAAQELAEQALNWLGDDVNVWIQIRSLEVLGRVALERGDLGTADERLSSALEMARRHQDAMAQGQLHIDLARLEAARGNGPTARGHLTTALDICDNSGEILSLMRVLDTVASLRALARPEAVLHLAGATTALRLRHGMWRLPREGARYQAAVDAASLQLRQATGDSAAESGHDIDLQAATRLARDLLESALPTAIPVAGPSRGPLTRREFEIATLLARGLTNRAIGVELFISEGTVRAHVEHILAKLGLKSRVEVAPRLAAQTVVG